MSLMTIEGIEKYYAGKYALCGVDMDIPSGKIIGLLGPNGSGKTTLLKCIAGLLSPDKGNICYPKDAKRGSEAKKTVSFLPDTMKFPTWMKVKDVFKFYEDMYPDFNKEKAEEMKRLLEIPEKVLMKNLSKGMQERVALGVTFSRDTSVYLLDEPLGGIDPVGKMKVLDSILSMQLSEASILLSTHLVKDVETIFDSVFLISQGRIAYKGDCEQIREETGKTVEQIYLEVFSYGQAV